MVGKEAKVAKREMQSILMQAAHLHMTLFPANFDRFWFLFCWLDPVMQLPRTPHEGDLDTTKGAPSLRGLSAGHPICPKFTTHRWAIAIVFMARSVFTVWFSMLKLLILPLAALAGSATSRSSISHFTRVCHLEGRCRGSATKGL